MQKLKRKIICITLIFMLLLPNIGFAGGFSDSDNVQKSIKAAISYLATMQNSDGGFTNREGRESSISITDWVVMALTAAGENVDSSKWMKNGNTPIDYLIFNSELEATNDYSRTLLALRAGGHDSRLNDIDLAEKIISFQKQNGQFAQFDKGEQEMINAHVWAIFALASAGKEIPNKEKAREWLLAQQNIDGGFSWAVGCESDPDSTGVAITALILLGEDEKSINIISAMDYLKNRQEENGGIGYSLYKANAASDAWAIQGLVAAQENLAESKWQINGNTPISHLLSLQKSDGSFKWMEEKESSPVLMTAYAVIALAERPFPVNLDFDNLQSSSLKISLSIDEKNSLVNGKKNSLDVPPTIINNRTMVPLRFVGESLGAEVEWIGETKTVEIILDNKKLSLVIGKTVPGLDTPATIVDGRTLVPIRYVSENLGAKVTWFAEDRRVEIER